jgi:hypothetical protein
MKKTSITYAVSFERFRAALEDLREMTERAKAKGLLETQRQEIVQAFESTHDLALETMNGYFQAQGRAPFSGSRDTTVEAFNEDLIDDGQGWLDMIIFRIKYNPLYPGDYLGSLSDSVVKKYITLLGNFERNFQNKAGS